MTIDDPAQRPPSMDDVTGLPEAKAAGGGHGFEGAVEFAQALRGAMMLACDEQTRRLCW